MIPRATEPFRFYTRLNLTRLTGLRAKNLKELLEHLKTVPLSVVYQHTYRFLKRHQYLIPEPPNDFSYWVNNVLQDEVLGERLSAINTVRFNSLEDLRQIFVCGIESHLEKYPDVRNVSRGKEFHFMDTVRFSVPTSYQAYDLSEFLDCLTKVSISSLYLHIFESRLRPPLSTNDFSNWFEVGLGETALAKKVADADPYRITLEGLRNKVLRLIEIRLEEYSRDGS